MSDELLEIIDEHENVLGIERRPTIHKKGLLHKEVYIIFYNKKGEIFFQKRSSAKDTNPGLLTVSASGHVEPEHDYLESAIREVKEETGLKVEVERTTGIYSKPHKDELVFAFKCKVISGELKLSNEADEHKYFQVSQIPSNTVPKQVERIKDFFSNQNIVHLKSQTGPSIINLIKQKTYE